MELKRESLNDKFKNNLINKIYNLESELSEKNNIVENLLTENKNLKDKVNKKDNSDLNEKEKCRYYLHTKGT